MDSLHLDPITRYGVLISENPNKQPVVLISGSLLLRTTAAHTIEYSRLLPRVEFWSQSVEYPHHLTRWLLVDFLGYIDHASSKSSLSALLVSASQAFGPL
jgi:hypothetical protein